MLKFSKQIYSEAVFIKVVWGSASHSFYNIKNYWFTFWPLLKMQSLNAVWFCNVMQFLLWGSMIVSPPDIALVVISHCFGGCGNRLHATAPSSIVAFCSLPVLYTACYSDVRLSPVGEKAWDLYQNPVAQTFRSAYCTPVHQNHPLHHVNSKRAVWTYSDYLTSCV